MGVENEKLMQEEESVSGDEKESENVMEEGLLLRGRNGEFSAQLRVSQSEDIADLMDAGTVTAEKQQALRRKVANWPDIGSGC